MTRQSKVSIEKSLALQDMNRVGHQLYGGRWLESARDKQVKSESGGKFTEPQYLTIPDINKITRRMEYQLKKERR